VPAFLGALRDRRVGLGLTQDVLAARLGWRPSRLRDCETGLRPILPRELTRWAGELGLALVALPAADGAP
jgi:transcriptional regulator with XRE-family HTH domain